MSDETEMNPELENFAANLQNVPAPRANIDRDQLMYEAGWAAALAAQQPKVKTQTRGVSSLAISFASGIAVATAVLLSTVPFFGNEGSNDQPAIAANDRIETETIAIEVNNLPDSQLAATNRDDRDLLGWIESLPPGHSIRTGFSSVQTSPKLANTSTDSRPVNQRSYRPKTSGQLMRELIPDAINQPQPPTWSAWLMLGG